MRYLLALEAAIVCVTIAAFISASVARLKWRWLRWTIAIVFVWFPALLVALERHSIHWVIRQRYAHLPTPTAVVAAAIGGLIGGMLVCSIFALWRRGPERRPLASRWRWRTLGWLFLISIAVFLITDILWGLALGRRAAQLRAAAKANLEQLGPPEVNDQENAALVYAEARRQLRGTVDNTDGAEGARSPEADAFWLEDTREVDPEWAKSLSSPTVELPWADVAAWTTTHGEALTTFERAAAMPACCFPRLPLKPWTPWDVPISEVRDLRTLASLEIAAARLAAEAGDLSACIRRLDALHNAAGHQANEPQPQRAILARMFEAMRFETLETVLGVREFPAESFPLPVTVDEVDFRAAGAQFVEGNSGDALNLMCSIWLGDVPPTALAGQQQRSAVQEANRWPRVDLIAYRPFVLADDLEASEFLRQFAKPLTTTPQYRWGDVSLWSADGTVWLLSQGLITSDLPESNVKVFLRATPRVEARQGLAALGLAVAAFEARRARYPATLAELVPEFIDKIPIDPWDGQPLRMVAVDGGIVLYALDEDVVDDGGRLIDVNVPYGRSSVPRSPTLREGDLTFCLGEVFRRRRIEGEGTPERELERLREKFAPAGP
jgi:hypothetical protein